MTVREREKERAVIYGDPDVMLSSLDLCIVSKQSGFKGHHIRARLQFNPLSSLFQSCTMSEDIAAAPGKGRGPFTLPPLAEIKQANRVTAADLHPAVFKPSSNETGTRRSDPPQQSAASSSSLLTTTPSHIVRTDTDVNKSTADNGDSGRGETTGESLNTRKRRRDEERDSAPEIFPVVAQVETNERVIPQLEKGERQTLGTASSADSAGSSSDVGETRRQAPTGPAPSASGDSEAAGTSSAVPAVHHPHAIVANLVQVSGVSLRDVYITISGGRK